MQSSPAIDQAAHDSWVDRILSAGPRQPETLLAALEDLDSRQDIATQAAVFESVVWRADVRHYWVWYRLARVYAELARPEASFFMAAEAVRLHPDEAASFTPFQIVFRSLAQRGEAHAALEAFAAQVAAFPEKPVAEAYEVDALQQKLGVAHRPNAAAPTPFAEAAEHRVVGAETRVPTPIRVVAGQLPHGLAQLEQPMQRTPVDVLELPDGELLVCRDAVVVRDGAGRVREDLSVAAFPDLIARRVLQPADADLVEQHEVAQAVLILDAFPPPNLCHFLLDQVSRLELYRRAGADLAQALVVGPELLTRYQRAIAARAGMTQVLGTQRLARVRTQRLWVSTECRALQHPAHYCADWAIAHARAVLGGRGEGGTRRLYISRDDAQARRVVNEAELVAELARHGFESITPGAMSYEEQIAAFRAASHVISAHGAALTHIVLCPPGARVLELFHPLYGTWAYAMLAAACGLDYAALCGRDGASEAPELNDPERVDLAAGRFGDRHVRIDPVMVRRWVEQAA